MTTLQILLYGSPGIGKTTFASLSEKPYFLDLENGAIGVPAENKKSFPLLGYNEGSKASMKKLNAFLDTALKSEGNNGLKFKTLVVDSLTRIDEYMTEEVLHEEKIKKLGDLPYGGGYALVKGKIMDIVNKFIALSILKNLNLVLIAHSKDKQISPKGKQAYDMVEPRLSKGALSTIIELVPYCFYLGKDIIEDKAGKVNLKTQLYTEADTFCSNVKSRVMLEKNIYNMTPEKRGTKAEYLEDINILGKAFWEELYTTWGAQ